MTTESDTLQTLTRHNLSVALQALAQVGQAEIARRLNLSSSTVSRIKSERLEEALSVLAACGLKVVPLEHSGDYSEFIDAALVFATYGLNAIRHDHHLLRGDVSSTQ